MIPPLRGKQLAALRAIAATSGGIRLKAYRSTMPLLEAMKLVELRTVSCTVHADGWAWFLATKGRAVVKAYEVDEA